MTRPPRKYFSETSVVLSTARCAMISPDELLSGKQPSNEEKELLDACHVYLICRRPRLSFDPDSFAFSVARSSGNLCRTVKGKRELHQFSLRVINEDGGPVSVAPYPHRDLLGRDRMGVVTRTWPATFVANLSNTCAELSDFEVLYVGQAFGDGTRSALARLQQHQTLQKILAETHGKNPDDEIMIFMFEYPDPQIHVSMDGIGKDAEINDQQDTDHILNVLENPPSEKEIISMAEAGLIWYFKPEFNEKLKSSQPNSNLKLLTSCYKYDIAGMVVEINTEELKCRLWSPQREAGYHHIAHFDLHDSEKRRSFFSLIDDNGDITLLDLSGPALR